MPLLAQSGLSHHGCNFLAACSALAIRLQLFCLAFAPAWQQGQKKAETSKQHTSPTEEESEVIGLRPVEEPA